MNFSQEIPVSKEEIEEYVKKLSNKDKIAEIIMKYLAIEQERYSMEQRLKCLMRQTRFTPKRLQEEFPEAYLIYMDIVTSDYSERNNDIKKPALNLCDTIENIRAGLEPNLKETFKSYVKEEV